MAAQKLTVKTKAYSAPLEKPRGVCWEAVALMIDDEIVGWMGPDEESYDRRLYGAHGYGRRKVWKVWDAQGNQRGVRRTRPAARARAKEAFLA